MEGCFKGLPGGPLSGPLLSKVGPDLDRGLRLAWDHLPLYSEATGRCFPSVLFAGQEGAFYAEEVPSTDLREAGTDGVGLSRKVTRPWQVTSSLTLPPSLHPSAFSASFDPE